MAESNVQLDLGFDRIYETFHIPSLHPEQKSCLQVLLEGKDIYASLPTGYGKSMIFFGAPILANYKLSLPRGTSKVLVLAAEEPHGEPSRTFKLFGAERYRLARGYYRSCAARGGKGKVYVLVRVSGKNAECEPVAETVTDRALPQVSCCDSHRRGTLHQSVGTPWLLVFIHDVLRGIFILYIYL